MLKDLKVGDSYKMRKNYLLGNILLINTACLTYGFLVIYSVFIYQKINKNCRMRKNHTNLELLMIGTKIKWIQRKGNCATLIFIMMQLPPKYYDFSFIATIWFQEQNVNNSMVEWCLV